MEQPDAQHKKQSAEPMLLPPAEDYLGQWILILQEHYPGEANEVSALGAAAYRVALGDLTKRELDLAFSETLRRHGTGFRPTSGEIRKYLREKRDSTVIPLKPMLAPAELCGEDHKAIADQFAQVAKKLGIR